MLKAATNELFNMSLAVLQENEDFKSAAARRFLKNPKGERFGGKSGNIEFKSKGTDFILYRESDLASERVMLATKSEGIEEHASLWLTYKLRPANSETHFGGMERGLIDKVAIAYRKDYRGEKPPEVQIDNEAAISKVRQFLHQI